MRDFSTSNSAVSSDLENSGFEDATYFQNMSTVKEANSNCKKIYDGAPNFLVKKNYVQAPTHAQTKGRVVETEEELCQQLNDEFQCIHTGRYLLNIQSKYFGLTVKYLHITFQAVY